MPKDFPPVAIPFSKAKLMLWVVICCLFFFAALWVLLTQPGHSILYRIKINLAGLVGICMGAFGIYIFGIRKLFNTEPGLVVDAMGITDNTSFIFSVGLIAWADIIEIKEQITKISILSKDKSLLVFVKNPDTFIAKQSSSIGKKTMMQRHNFVGTPITITAHHLKISFEELKALLQNRLNEFKNLP
jgi:hypothetical protein